MPRLEHGAVVVAERQRVAGADVEAVVEARVVEVVAEAREHHRVDLEVVEDDLGRPEGPPPARLPEELPLGEAEERLRDVDALSEVIVLQALHSDENAFSAVLFNRSGQPPPRRTAKRVELTISPNKNMHSAPTGSFAMTFSKFARG